MIKISLDENFNTWRSELVIIDLENQKKNVRLTKGEDMQTVFDGCLIYRVHFT